MPAGRIILKSISDSRKLSRVKTDGARLLYTWLLTHLDINGCFSGDPQVIRGKVFTRLNKTIKTIDEYLKDMEDNKLIIRYKVNGDMFLNVPDFVEKQPSLNPKKEGKSNIPLPTPELLQSYSRVTPTQVKESKVKESKVKYSANSIELSLSKLLFKKIRERNPEYKKPDLQTWAIHIDLMIRIDKRSPEVIEKIIIWCQQDDFWQDNILSTGKLRRQYDQLYMKMNKNQKTGNSSLKTKAYKCYLSMNYGACFSNYQANDKTCQVCKSESSNWQK